MNRFEPLGYVAATLTTWHFVIGGAFLMLIGVVMPLANGEAIKWSWLPIGGFAIISIYALFVLLFGQVFGDKYPFGMIWPSGVIVGAVFSALPFLIALFNSSDQSSSPPTWFAAVGVFIGANFFAIGLWLLPRMVGFGFFELPKLSWGVKLLP